MKTVDRMNAAQLCAHLAWIEVDGSYPPDMRRILSDERMRLMVTLHRGDRQEIAETIADVRHVAKMWGVP